MRVLVLAIILALSVPLVAQAAPDLLHRGSVVLDLAALGGDNDRFAEPGETFDLVLTLGNEGNDAARSITATLASSNPSLTVGPLPPSIAFPDIPANGLGTGAAPHFRLTAAAAIPCGQPVQLNLRVSYQDSGGTPYSQVVPFLLFVGQATVLAREDFDTGPGGWEQDDAGSTPVEPPNRAGRWVTAAPQGYLWGGEPAQPGRDISYPDLSCMYTGQNISAGNPTSENVDGGNQVLRSRNYDLTGATNAWVSFARWFYTDDTSGADSWTAQVSNDGGLSWQTLESVAVKANAWTYVAYRLDTVLPLTATVEFRILVADGGVASVCEGAIDDFVIASYRCFVDPPEARLDSAAAGIVDSVDPLCTDGDGIADAGETVDFQVTVSNSGTAPATNATATLVTPLPPELSLVGPATIPLGTLADNGGTTMAPFRLLVADPLACQVVVLLEVVLAADPPFQAQRRAYALTLEEDINLPTLSWYDDFDSGLTAWTIQVYGTANNDWAASTEDCVQNPGTPPTSALNFWYTGSTGIPTDCSANPYGPLDDSAIRTPVIDTGFVVPQLLNLRWNHLLTLTPGDADAAEIWVDHDLDGIFTLVQRFQGQITTNGDVLDPALVDLSGLIGATRYVQFEMRFITDGTGGGGNPLALGWIVDNVELNWTDANGRTCDGSSCAPCQIAAQLTTTATQACVNQQVTLDASGSTPTGCLGILVFDWFRDGLPLQSGPSSILVQEPAAGNFAYSVDVSCSTDPTCADSASQRVLFVDCPNCSVQMVFPGAPSRVCANTAVPLDATGSTALNCPSPGVTVYEWYRDGLLVANTPLYTPVEPVAGTYMYQVVVYCSTDPTCSGSAAHVLQVDPDGMPLPVGNTLRGQKALLDVELLWTDPQILAFSWQMDRAMTKGTAGVPFAAPSPTFTDPGAVPAPGGTLFLYLYQARAVSCSGIVGP